MPRERNAAKAANKPEPDFSSLDFDLKISTGGGVSLPSISFGALGIDEMAPEYSPLAEVEYTGSMEVDSKAEMQAMREAFAGSDTARQFRNAKAQAESQGDSEFWFCVCFQTRDQKNEFLEKTGLMADGDKYIDGQAVARKFGVELAPLPPTPKQGRMSPLWASMALAKE